MRKIDESERPMPEIDLAKVCFIIEKSREYLARTQASSRTIPTRRTTKNTSC
jgi:hypothetical protein